MLDRKFTKIHSPYQKLSHKFKQTEVEMVVDKGIRAREREKEKEEYVPPTVGWGMATAVDDDGGCGS